MNKGDLIKMIALAAALTMGIAVAVAYLFSGKEEDALDVSIERFIEGHKLVEAVPSDAAIVLCAKNFGRMQKILLDPVADQVFSGKLGQLATQAYSGRIGRSPAILSSHYSKDLAPLLVVEAPEAAADSSADLSKLLAAADSSGLFHRVEGGRVFISSSETLINSSIRHLDEGRSVLETEGFSDLAAKVSKDEVLFLAGSYSEILTRALLARKHWGLAGFFAEQSNWTALELLESSSKGISLLGRTEHAGKSSSWLEVLRNSGETQPRIAEVLPANTILAASLPIEDIGAYIKSHRSLLDARNELGKYKSTLASLRNESSGPDPEEWAKSLGIKEAAVAMAMSGDELRKVVLLRAEKKPRPESHTMAFEYAGYPKVLFGDLFSCESEDACAAIGSWLAIGDSLAVKEWSGEGFLRETLKERLSGNGLSHRLPQKGCRFYLFHSLGEAPGLFEATLSPAMARSCGKAVEDVSFAPLTVSASPRHGEVCLSVNADKARIFKSKAPLPGKDCSVEVPTGPFKVRNSHTGQTNTLYQNSHLSICLRDENGKDVWGVPFKEKLCGFVEEVDFFDNGKLQYLFAAGSKLYLIDRLGRFVGGFPVDLEKEVLLGPKLEGGLVEGGKGIIALHKDNTIGMYDLRGRRVPAWKGIASDETIMSLPEPLEVQGRKYWTVRTSVQALVFPYEGGEPLVKGSGDKMIRPESELTINEKGQVCAKCYDGKDRTFKIEQQ